MIFLQVFPEYLPQSLVYTSILPLVPFAGMGRLQLRCQRARVRTWSIVQRHVHTDVETFRALRQAITTTFDFAHSYPFEFSSPHLLVTIFYWTPKDDWVIIYT